MGIPVGLAEMAGLLRSGRVRRRSPKTFLAPLSRVLKYSGEYVDRLAFPPKRRGRKKS